MALKVTTTGSGAIGPLQPGWSAQEYATPFSINERAGGTGAVAFSARTEEETALILNNFAKSEHERLGSVEGVIYDVGSSGMVSSISQKNALHRFDGDRYIPPLMQGSGQAALDIATQVTGTVRLNLPGA